MEAILSALLNRRRPRASARGVTLIELMIVVVVMAILASIAVPSYRRYLIRANRTEARIALLQLQTAQEKFYLQNNVYTNKVADASPTGLGLLSTTETGKYAIEVTTLATGGQSYTATATPATGGGQADDKDCTTFTITDRGVKGMTGLGTVEKCWK
jgi:type IV pilus assembly protein PilE